MKPCTLISLMVGARATQLTSQNYDALTFGKAVFLKFFSPDCHFCQKVAPAWERLTQEFENHETIFVGEVDCTTSGKTLCQQLMIDGYPSFKIGDPVALQDYEGGREFEMLKLKASALKPGCGMANMDACTPQQKKRLNEFMDLSGDLLEEQIKSKETEVTKFEKEYQDLVKKLQRTFETAKARREKMHKDVTAGDLGLMKSVRTKAALMMKAQSSIMKATTEL